MIQLSDFLESKNLSSKFKTNLGVQGGVITFSNTNGNTFAIGLDAILTCIKDFVKYPEVFSGDQSYDEKPWRDKGSQYYTHPVPRSLATVQTKPLFTTLSKTIVWANQPNLDSVNTDNVIPLRLDALNKTILELEKLIIDFTPNKKKQKSISDIKDLSESQQSYLTAIRTKPFILLAGISGTGKSRLVRELAFMSCPKVGKLGDDDTTPGNYCMIEVKPNWHDSSELLGYISGLQGKYIVTPFVKFLVKAMRYPEVPFFVCLDEMNLAPVEQYFAEYLSVLETRTLKNGRIVSGSLINKDVFINHEDIFESLGLKNEERTDLADELVKITAIENELKEFGLRLPQNVIVVGTVNMDDTTHQFSRKVIDRAMTFEMNQLDFNTMFEEEDRLVYTDKPLEAALFISDCVSANEALDLIEDDDIDSLKTATITLMQTIDEKLKDTPFRVAYRVQNELVLYYRNLLLTNSGKSFEELFPLAADALLQMKVLPRIEGDEDMVKNPLVALDAWTAEKGYTTSNAKIKEMLLRLNRSHYTSYWP